MRLLGQIPTLALHYLNNDDNIIITIIINDNNYNGADDDDDCDNDDDDGSGVRSIWPVVGPSNRPALHPLASQGAAKRNAVSEVSSKYIHRNIVSKIYLAKGATKSNRKYYLSCFVSIYSSLQVVGRQNKMMQLPIGKDKKKPNGNDWEYTSLPS